jgi:hypothetical protein
MVIAESDPAFDEETCWDTINNICLDREIHEEEFLENFEVAKEAIFKDVLRSNVKGYHLIKDEIKKASHSGKSYT